MLKFLATALLAVILAACSSPLSGEYSGSNGKTLPVTQKVWGWYKDYVSKISGVNKGVFVVGISNGIGVSASYYYCPADGCMAANYAKKAIDMCKGFPGNLDCILFAQSADIRVNYKVMGE